MEERALLRLEELLERLGGDPVFVKELLRDPRTALAGYELSTDDLYQVVARLAIINSGWSPVEARKRAAAIFRALAAPKEDEDTKEARNEQGRVDE